MRCKHENYEVLKGPSQYLWYRWCTDCGSYLRIAYGTKTSRWTYPKLWRTAPESAKRKACEEK